LREFKDFVKFEMRKPKINEFIRVKGIPDLIGKEVRVTAVALGYVWIKSYKGAREDIEVPLDLVEFINPETFSLKEKKELIKKWVKPENLRNYKDIVRELGFFSKIFERYPNLEFWKQFEPGFLVASLSWWLNGGKDDIRAAFNTFSLDLSPSNLNNAHIQNEKIGEDVQVRKKISYRDL
jgi:hypothetical protein